MVTVVDAVTTGMDESFENSMAMFGRNVIYIQNGPGIMTMIVGNNWAKRNGSRLCGIFRRKK